MAPPPTGPSFGADSPVPGLSGLAVLARGGFATVYRAFQESVGREVALKIDNRTLETERDRRRFLREAHAAGRVSGHPHVVDLFDAGVTADNRPYLVMELCTTSYRQRLRTEGPLPPDEVRHAGARIADALAAAHASGVLHRDVKPANLLIDRYGNPLLADFGLAVVADSHRISTPTLDALTPAYAPPETFRFETPAPPGDVYSLAATLYTLLAGKPPRFGDAGTPGLAELVRLFDEPVPDLPGVPADLVAVLRAALDSDPAARPDAAQLRDQLDQPPGPVATSAAATSALPPEPATVVVPRRVTRRRRRRLIASGIAGVMALLLAGAAAVMFRDRDEPVEQQLTATPSAAPSVAAAGCAFAPEGARCPEQPECYADLEISRGWARARSVSCDRPHTWEVFVLGDLPRETRTVKVAEIRRDPAIQRLCDPAALYRTIPIDEALEWRVEVLPPSPEKFADGDRTVRCLAGKGRNALSKPVFA